MNTGKLIGKWNSLSIKWKILTIVIFFILLGMATRSLLLAIAAWVIIIYFVVKTLSDWEVL
jgi:hypothetical protein